MLVVRYATLTHLLDCLSSHSLSLFNFCIPQETENHFLYLSRKWYQKGFKVEPTGIEPVSALGIDLPLIHRLSPSDPQGGNRSLSRTVGYFGNILASKRPKATY